MIAFRNTKLLYPQGTGSLSQCKFKKCYERFEAENSKPWFSLNKRLDWKLSGLLIYLVAVVDKKYKHFYLIFFFPKGNPVWAWNKIISLNKAAGLQPVTYVTWRICVKPTDNCSDASQGRKNTKVSSSSHYHPLATSWAAPGWKKNIHLPCATFPSMSLCNLQSHML